jgi:hypothetical protein
MHLPSCSAPSPCTAPAAALAASASTWYRRLKHPDVDALSKLSSDSSVVCSRHTHNFCHACQLGCHTRMPFVSSTSRTDNIFDIIHCDMRTSPIVSISSYTYYRVILDDHSHFVWTFPLQVKSDTFSLCHIFRTCACLVVPAILISLPKPLRIWHPGPPDVFFLDTPLTTKDTGVSISPPKTSSPPDTLFLMR